MSYPGNPSLAPEVRRRILETWEHTRGVAAEGKTEEAKLGCDFILRLDPLFNPAQRLSDRLEGAEGPVNVDDLVADAAEPAEAAAPPELDDLPELPMEEIPETGFPEEPAGAAGGEPVVASDLRSEIAELVAIRDFPSLMTRAQEEQDAIAADPELQRMLGEAQEKMEAAPYVESFLERAESAFEAGDEDTARAALEKARALDGDHPRVQALDASLGVAVSSGAEPMEGLADIEAGEEAFPDESAEVAEFAMDDLPELPELDGDAEQEAPASGGGLEADGDEEFGDGDELSLEGLGELPSLEGSLEDAPGGPGAEPGPERPSAPSGPSDPDPRIAELLDEGQDAFDREEFQGAIDAWSRIFLIDIDHQEAARRIERARDQKSEEERKVEEAYHEALAHVESDEMEEARVKLERVLEMAPNHMAAAQSLEKLEKGELTAADVTGTRAGEELLTPEAGLEPEAEVGASRPSLPMAEVMVPPEPGEERPSAPSEPERAAAGSRRPLVLAVAALVAVVLGVAGFLWFRSGSLFPNTETEDSGIPVPVQETTPIERATQLFEEGRAGVAIAQLKRLPPASPYYQEAQALLSRWESGSEDEGPAPEEFARREALIDEASEAFEEERFLEAIPLYEEADGIAPLGSDAEARLEEARTVVRPLEPLVDLVRAGEYERVLRDLWVQREEDPNNRVVNQLLAASYYNLGVRSLQQGRPNDAIGHFQEVMSVDPDDEAAARLLDLAETYDGRSQDLLYRIYVKYLAPRAV